LLFLKFIIVGILCTILSSILLPFFYFKTENFVLSITITTLICLSLNYILHRYFVFKSFDKIRYEIARFFVGGVLFAIINGSLAYLVLKIFGDKNFYILNLTLNFFIAGLSFMYHNLVSFIKTRRRT